jgi:hypothetical protein
VTGYSPVEHLARSIWPTSWQDGFLGMFTGYYDASGGDDTGIMAVAGFVADVRKWQEFEPSWRLVLATNHLPYFHMKEFTHSTGEVFSSWKGKETKRENLLRDLIQVVAETADFWVCCSIRTAILDWATKRYGVTFDGRGYPLVARMLIGLAHNTSRARHGVAEITHVFERGDEGKGQLVEMIERLNRLAEVSRAKGAYYPKLDPYARLDPYPIPIPIFKPSRDTPTERGLVPLQAGDFVAWEFHKLHHDVVRRSTRLRKSLREIRKRIPGEHKVMNESGLMGLIESMGISPK